MAWTRGFVLIKSVAKVETPNTLKINHFSNLEMTDNQGLTNETPNKMLKIKQLTPMRNDITTTLESGDRNIILF